METAERERLAIKSPMFEAEPQGISYTERITRYCPSLYCTILYCPTLYCTILYCPSLYCTVLYCPTLYCTVLYYPTLYCTVLYCTSLHCFALYCTLLSSSLPSTPNPSYFSFSLYPLHTLLSLSLTHSLSLSLCRCTSLLTDWRSLPTSSSID